MAVRYRITDIFTLITVVALLIGGYKLGFKLKVPHYLTGNFAAYQVNEMSKADLKTWHKLPPESLRDRLYHSLPKEEYAILQASPSPLVATKQTHWLLLLYDISITILVITLAVIVVRHCRCNKTSARSIKV